MRNRSVCVLGALGALVVLNLAGCPLADSRLSNQGGGTVFTALAKVTGEKLAQLNPDELQILADTVSDLSDQVEINLTDEQAAAAIDFLAANNLNSFPEVEAFIAEAEQNPGSVVIPDSLQALIDSGVSVEDIVAAEQRDTEASP